MLAKIFLVALITFFAAGEPACPYAGVNPPPAKIRPLASKERLQERVGAYYAALTDHDFKRIWDRYLSAYAKEENKSEKEFVIGMSRFFAKASLVEAPRVLWLGILGPEEKKRSGGKVETRLSITMNYGGRFTALHTTFWVWEDPEQGEGRPVGASGDWWLLNDDEVKATAPAPR